MTANWCAEGAFLDCPASQHWFPDATRVTSHSVGSSFIASTSVKVSKIECCTLEAVSCTSHSVVASMTGIFSFPGSFAKAKITLDLDASFWGPRSRLPLLYYNSFKFQAEVALFGMKPHTHWRIQSRRLTRCVILSSICFVDTGQWPFQRISWCLRRSCSSYILASIFSTPPHWTQWTLCAVRTKIASLRLCQMTVI